MPVPFLLRVEADDAEAAERVATALRAALAPRGARFRIETMPRAAAAFSIPASAPTTLAASAGVPASATAGARAGPVMVSPGVWDAEGRPRWLTPLPVDADAQAAAVKVVAFLESWGFIARGAPVSAS